MAQLGLPSVRFCRGLNCIASSEKRLSMGRRSSQSCYSSRLEVKNQGRRTCMGLQNSVRRSTYNTSGRYSGVASNGTREDTVNKPPDLKEGMRCHPAVVCSTIRNGPPAGFTGMCACACVLVCEWLRAEGGFIELCWVAAAPEPRATKKAFHCSVVEVAVLCSKHFCMWCHEATN